MNKFEVRLTSGEILLIKSESYTLANIAGAGMFYIFGAKNENHDCIYEVNDLNYEQIDVLIRNEEVVYIINIK